MYDEPKLLGHQRKMSKKIKKGHLPLTIERQSKRPTKKQTSSRGKKAGVAFFKRRNSIAMYDPKKHTPGGESMAMSDIKIKGKGEGKRGGN